MRLYFIKKLRELTGNVMIAQQQNATCSKKQKITSTPTHVNESGNINLSAWEILRIEIF